MSTLSNHPQLSDSSSSVLSIPSATPQSFEILSSVVSSPPVIESSPSHLRWAKIFLSDIHNQIESELKESISVRKEIIESGEVYSFTKDEMIKAANTDMKKFQSLKRQIEKIQLEMNTGKISTGLNRPYRVSQELREFLGWKEGELHTRSEVTSQICKYIKSNQLQVTKNGRGFHMMVITPDENLKNLLKLTPESAPLTYSSLQRYINPLFKKN